MSTETYYDKEHQCSGYDKVPDGEEGLGFQYDDLNGVWNVPNESDAAGLGDIPSRYIIFFCPMCGEKLPTDD